LGKTTFPFPGQFNKNDYTTKKMQKQILFGLLAIGLLSCGASNQKTPVETVKTESTLSFDSDSAYQYVEAQTLFGPRVLNTTAHDECRNFLVKTMRRFGATVTEQKATLIAYDGTKLNATNIIASYQPEKRKRFLLCAHWDSRPWADNDPLPANHHSPILGANDGASGVGVLMEIGRQLQLEAAKGHHSEYGVDIVFFDAEDMGVPEFSDLPDNEDSWCLGTQYWAAEAKKTSYRAEIGILLDMVGGQGANFQWDYYSNKYAPEALQKIWEKAASLGYNNYFKPAQGSAITDDHLYVNRIAGIPCIDIIDFDPESKTGFVPYWHTLDDTMKNIDKNTLKAVGETLMYVLYD
jgi:hypothetical protein